MANTAKVINFPVPDVAPKEPRVADLDDGYTRLANELLDAVMCSGLPETELCILMAVWRKTYGYNKKMDWISNEQLEEMIQKHHTHCSTAKNSLIRKKVLIQEGRRVGMNIHISEWQTKNNGFCKTLAKPAKKTLAEVANAPKQKLLTTKDKLTKDNIK
ncbi:replication protein, partial [Salmonella enterica]|nr:replication protein [Salmonella enterica]